MSQVEVDKIIPQSATTLTLGESGDTVSVPSGVTLSSGANLTLTGALSVDGAGATIKLDGDYPVGSANVALGNGALLANTIKNFNTADLPLDITLQAGEGVRLKEATTATADINWTCSLVAY